MILFPNSSLHPPDFRIMNTKKYTFRPYFCGRKIICGEGKVIFLLTFYKKLSTIDLRTLKDGGNYGESNGTCIGI